MKQNSNHRYQHTQRANVIIEAPSSDVWQVLADFSAVDTWVPFVESSHIEGNIEQGVGIQRHCDLGKAGKISEKVTAWNEGKSLSYEVSGLGPMKALENNWDISEQGPNRSKVDVELKYTVKFGLLGRVLHFFVLSPVLKKRIKSGALMLLKKRVETGEVVRSRRAPVGEAQRTPATA